MAKRFEFNGLSKRGRTLLSNSEDKSVDFKAMVKGLHSDDLVSFANSDNGGVILIGVEEGVDTKGRQIGIPIGCKIGDDSKMQILNKALDCSPPVQIEIYTENISKNPFYRVEIASSPYKPHCTGRGTYKIREDGRNAPLLPESLLKMFVAKESKLFRERFTQATENLENKMTSTLDMVGELEIIISSKIEDISGSLDGSEYEASNASSIIADVDSRVDRIERSITKNRKRIKALLNHLEANDPVIEEAKKELFVLLVEKLRKEAGALEAVLEGKSVSITGRQLGELNRKMVSELLTEAAKKVKEERDSEN